MKSVRSRAEATEITPWDLQSHGVIIYGISETENDCCAAVSHL